MELSSVRACRVHLQAAYQSPLSDNSLGRSNMRAGYTRSMQGRGRNQVNFRGFTVNNVFQQDSEGYLQSASTAQEHANQFAAEFYTVTTIMCYAHTIQRRTSAEGF
jgi:hypothetical protein